MENLKLKNPITIDGKEIKEVKYDFEALTVGDIADASHFSMQADKPNLAEFDYAFHLALFVFAAAKAMNCAPEDFKNIRGKDALKALQLGRSFFMLSDASEEEISDAPLPS